MESNKLEKSFKFLFQKFLKKLKICDSPLFYFFIYNHLFGILNDKSIFKIKINDEEKKNINSKIYDINNFYENFNFPILNLILNILENKKKYNLKYSSLKTLNQKTIQNIFKKELENNNEIEIDKIVKEQIIKGDKNINYKNIKYYYVKEKFIIFSRIKDKKSIIKKLEKKIEIIINKKITFQQIIAFLDNKIKNISDYKNLKDEIYENENVKKIEELMLTDIYGIKIIFLYDINIDKIKEKIYNFNENGFISLNYKYKDRYKENLENQRKGIHCVLIKKDFPFFPIEFQILDFKSGVYDYFGENSHQFYKNN